MSSGELIIETTKDALDQLLDAMDEDAVDGKPETEPVDDDKDDNEDDEDDGGESQRDEKEYDAKHFERISKMYIKAETCSGYNSLNRMIEHGLAPRSKENGIEFTRIESFC